MTGFHIVHAQPLRLCQPKSNCWVRGMGWNPRGIQILFAFIKGEIAFVSICNIIALNTLLKTGAVVVFEEVVIPILSTVWNIRHAPFNLFPGGRCYCYPGLRVRRGTEGSGGQSDLPKFRQLGGDLATFTVWGQLQSSPFHLSSKWTDDLIFALN